MNRNKETVAKINHKIYNELKTKLLSVNQQFVRNCRFVREIEFDYKNYNNIEQETEPTEFRIWMDRNDYTQLYLIAKDRYGEIVNESRTKITRDEVSHILQPDIRWLMKSKNIMIRQLALQMQFNECYPYRIREYFQELYVNTNNQEQIVIRSMEILVKNNVREFFSEDLSAMNHIDYDDISLVYKQRIKMPLLNQA